ncbi:Hypp6437 [Branchiostoma lanceolatum]|uniref:Hypp6437 protein n=1 Tax=Branchiostoma lanceolatum TaxID=7740 RepID=A0A8K0EAC6_BRALA|nr:Hypp6437 [Branchiostoma lanceolatum]
MPTISQSHGKKDEFEDAKSNDNVLKFQLTQLEGSQVVSGDPGVKWGGPSEQLASQSSRLLSLQPNRCLGPEDVQLLPDGAPSTHLRGAHVDSCAAMFLTHVVVWK